MAIQNSSRELNRSWRTSSFLRHPKKLSANALSQQFPFRRMFCLQTFSAKTDLKRSLAYWLPGSEWTSRSDQLVVASQATDRAQVGHPLWPGDQSIEAKSSRNDLVLSLFCNTASVLSEYLSRGSKMPSNQHSGDMPSRTNLSAPSSSPASESWLSQAYQAPANAIHFVENHPREILEWTAVLAVSATSLYLRHPNYSSMVIREIEPAINARTTAGVWEIIAKVDAATSRKVDDLPELILGDTNADSLKEAQIGLASPDIPADTYVNPFASIGKNVKLGKQVQIEFYSQVGDDSEIADGAILERNVRVGKNVKILGQPENGFSGALIGSETSVGDNVTIEPGVHIGSRVKIDSGVVIGRNAFIQDDAIVHKDVNIGNAAHLSHHTIVRANAQIQHDAYLGNYSTIGQGANIGPGVFIRDKFVGRTNEVFRQISIGDRTTIGTAARVFKSIAPNLRIASGAIVN
jgi:acetyltransferase-like isoleucine patch superfamily enzyme